jgi:hypothetical protein
VTWHRIDAGYFRNRKVRKLTHKAQVLDLAAILYSNTELTDGAIDREVLGLVLQEAQASKREVEQLVTVGRWEPTATGHYVHDFKESGINPPADKVREKRESHRKEMADLRAAKRAKASA